jgi:hypothetical protein
MKKLIITPLFCIVALVSYSQTNADTKTVKPTLKSSSTSEPASKQYKVAIKKSTPELKAFDKKETISEADKKAILKLRGLEHTEAKPELKATSSGTPK